MGFHLKRHTLNVMYCRSINSQFIRKQSGTTPKLRFIQYLHKSDSRKRLGAVSQDGCSLIQLSAGSCISYDMQNFLKQGFSVAELTDKLNHLRVQPVNDSITLLPPLANPGKIICVSLNYPDTCMEEIRTIPSAPIILNKFNTSLVGPLDKVVAHNAVKHLDWGVQLAVVIGKRAQNVPVSSAMEYVFGYTIAQDIRARDWQKFNGGQFLMSMSMDTFCPLGPSIVHKSEIKDIYNLNMRTCVNGVQKQFGNTCTMIFGIEQIIHALTKRITLLPGDVILTGTPGGGGSARKKPAEHLKVGDEIKTQIEMLGSLRNKIVKPL